MKRIKQCLTAVAAVTAMCFAFTAMTFAGTGSYSFTMNNMVVDGSKNNIYYSLDKGAVYISGTHWECSTDQGALDTYNPITYVLLRKRVGPDKGCGSIKCSLFSDPSGQLGTADTNSSDYYLQVYKVEDDGHNIEGNGTIYN